MKINTNKVKCEYFKKSFSVGHHNVRYTWMQLMLMILNCIKCLESVESGAKSPSAQTIRDRLNLEGMWLEYFHESMYRIAKWALLKSSRLRWFISIDETHIPFFGKRKKLNAELVKKGLGKYVYAYRAKTPGATGSFCFVVISLCCCKIRIPLAIKMVKVGERYKPWLRTELEHALRLAPKAIVLADRGFGKATWFYKLLEELDILRVIKFAKAVGIKGPFPYDLTLALGSLSVTPLELTSAYSVFANNGIRNQPVAILKVEDSQGNPD